MSRTLRLAYKLIRTAALADRIEFLKKKYPQISPEDINELSRLDPTGGKYLEWLVRVLTNEKNYPPGFWADARSALKMYSEIVKSPVLAEMYGVSRDINKLSAKDILEIWRREYGELEDWRNVRLTSEALRAKKVKQQGSKLIYDKNGYRIVQFGGKGMDPERAVEALCMFNAGTEWCTRRPDSAKHYLNKGPVYIVYKGDSKIAQMSGSDIQSPDHSSINLRQNPELTKVLVDSGAISSGNAYDLLSRGWGEKGPWPELEPALAKDPETAEMYASMYLHGRFPLGEKAIAQNIERAYSYVMNTALDRIPIIEEAILKDPVYGPLYQGEIDEGYFDFLRERRERRERKRDQLQNA